VEVGADLPQLDPAPRGHRGGAGRHPRAPVWLDLLDGEGQVVRARSKGVRYLLNDMARPWRGTSRGRSPTTSSTASRST
jgi:hypothetical protein